jgi:peptidyl-prolyl cis-trans isomerase A (cyclophilin A)
MRTLFRACTILLALAAARPVAAEIVNPVVRFTVLGGNFVDVELYADTVPTTVANFLNYVEAGAYTNTFFNRSRNQFQPFILPYTPSVINILQAGGYTIASGSSGPVVTPVASGSTIPLEAVLPNVAGTIAMARGSSPNSASNQWFFNLTDNPSLDPSTNSDGYAVFGRVISGMNVLYTIADQPTTDFNGVDPLTPGYDPDNLPFGYVPLVNVEGNHYFATIDSVTVTAVPEPSGIALAAAGIALAAVAARRQRRPRPFASLEACECRLWSHRPASTVRDCRSSRNGAAF